MKTILVGLTIVVLIIAVGFLFQRAGGSTALASEASANSGFELGSVRLVANGQKPEQTIELLVVAAMEAGWMEAEMKGLDTVNFFPPPNYRPEMFGRLLEALEASGATDFGLQLIDKAGRAIGPDGKPAE
jgi:hypothetical protein